jgi:magnesium transporter
MSEVESITEAEFDPAALARRLANEHPANIVEALNDHTPQEAAALVLHFPVERAIDILDQSGLECPTEIIDAMPREIAVQILSGISADRLTDIFRHLEEESRNDLLGRLDPETRLNLQRLLAYPEDTAGSIMTTEFVSVPANWTVAQTLDHIRKVERTRETVYAIYVLDPKTKKLVQSVSLRRLISGDPNASVVSCAPHRRPVTVAPLTDREDVARLVSKYDLLAVPVVSASGLVLGICTVDDIIDAIVEETTEDVQRFGGMEALHEPYMQIGFLEMIRARGGWLAALFLSEMLTASAMQGFQGELEKAIVLTLFIPLIMSSGGNSGSQATSLIIRALAVREVELRDWWRVALRELPSGIALGAMLGAIGILRIAIWQKFGFYDYGEHWVLVALTVAAALIGIVMFGSLAGSMLPFILQRLGFDPASASAPFVATLVDVTGLVIYFSVASLILRGTLL